MPINSIFFFLILVGSLVFGKPIFAEAAYQDVVFSELMWMGSNSSYADEWLELKNTTSQNIDLTNWQITYLKDNQETLLLTIPSGIIPAQGYFLIANGQQNKQYSEGESILALDSDLIDSSLTLSNSDLQLKLFNGNWNDGRSFIDIVGDGGTPFKGDNTHKVSMERIFPLGSGNLVDSWQNANLRKNLDPTAREIANPNNSGRPVVISVFSTPPVLALKNGETREIKIEAKIADPDGLADVEEVKVDLSALGGSNNQLLNDNGSNGDKIADDGIYSLTFSFTLTNPKQQIGQKNILLEAKDYKSLLTNHNFSFSIYQLSDNLVINEILPRPEGGSEEEFIELYNRSNEPINLFGWQMDDEVNKSSSPYKLDGLIMEVKSYLTLSKTVSKISLDDSGDMVRLLNPLGIEQAVVKYEEKPAKNWTYNFTTTGWVWSTYSSHGRENNIIKPAEESVVSTISLTFHSKPTNKSTAKIAKNQSSTSQTSGGQSSDSSNEQLLQDLLASNLVADTQYSPQLFWIKFTQYVIIFTIVICIILLFYVFPTNLSKIKNKK